MGGYKTILAGIGGILAGLALVAKAFTGEAPVEFNQIWEGIVAIIASLGLLGLGGKLQKLIETIKK